MLPSVASDPSSGWLSVSVAVITAVPSGSVTTMSPSATGPPSSVAVSDWVSSVAVGAVLLASTTMLNELTTLLVGLSPAMPPYSMT